MKRKRILSFAAVAAMMAACSSNDIPAPVVDAMTDKPITVRAGVATLTTRAGMTTDNLSNLGLSITNPTSTKYTYKNVKFEKLEGAATFTLAAEQVTPLWQNATQPVTVTAYSPYADGWTEGEQTFSIKADQTTEANVEASDLLWVQHEVAPATASGETDPIRYKDGALDIALAHQMAKLTVILRTGTALNPAPTFTGMTVGGFVDERPFDLSSGDWKDITKTETTDIQMMKRSDNTSFEALLIPQTAKLSITIVTDGSTYMYEKDNVTLDAGTSYTLNLVVGKDKVEVASASASEWGAGTDGKMESE